MKKIRKQGQKEEKRKNEYPEHEGLSTGGHSDSTSDYLSFLYYTNDKCNHCDETKTVLEEVHDL